MATVTPDVETDVLQKLSALLPASVIITGSTRNAWAGPERGVDEGFPMLALFVQVYGGQADWNGQDRQRWFDVQVLVRSARLAYSAGEVLARAIFDALDGVGPWTGPTSGALYQDLVASGAGPISIGASDADAFYFSVNATAWREG